MEIPQLLVIVPGLRHSLGEEISSGVQPVPPNLHLYQPRTVVSHRIIWNHQEVFDSIILVVGCSQTPFTSLWLG